jgi:hypothetical protein
MAIEKIVNLKVQDDFGKAEESVKSLRQQVREATANVAIMSEKFGATSKEAIEAAKRAAELKDRIGDAKDLTDAFNPDAKFDALAKSLAGVAGGFAVVQGAVGLFGEENKELEKQILKVQSAMALAQGAQAIGQSVDSFKQLGAVIKTTAVGQAVLTAATSVYNFVVGASTTALKAFRVALIGTGIGALVVGVGLLIANFEKISNWVSNLIEKFGGWRNVLMVVATPIWAIVKALEAMGAIETEAEEKSRKAAEAKAARNKKEASELEKRKTQIGDYYDFEIAKAEASGKDTFELEKKKRDAIIATARAINERMRATIQDGTATEAEIKRWNENQALITKLQQENVTSELKRDKEKNDKLAEQQKEANQKAKERREKNAADIKSEREKEAQEFQRHLDQQRDAIRQQELDIAKAVDEALELKANSQLTAQQIEEKAVNDKYFRLKELASQNKDDLKAIEDAQAIELAGIKNKYDEEAIAKKKEKDEKEQSILKEHLDKMLAAQQFFEDQKQSLISNGLDFLRVFAGKNKDIAKALLLIEKGLAIANIVSNTAKAIAQAKLNLVQTPFVLPGGLGPNPFWGKQAAVTASGIATAKVSAGVAIATILAQTIEGLSGGGVAGGGGGGGGDTGGSAPAAPQFNIVGQNPNNQLAATIAGQQGQPIRAYVVGQEVTTQQSLDRQIRNTATFNS